MDPAIKVENISKRYQIGLARQRHDTLRDALVDGIRHIKPLRRVVSESEDLVWALRDISFEIQPGEVVGIIGRNGAGKSTLLKILSRITEPTSGRAVINGRVGSLLEVGTGFHPELTGRENIFLNGAILGMRRKEIEGKFDEIVDFAEINKFLDTPVKRYSSGMYVRLAFAVAAHLEPEILLVDEVLAVGDAMFQKKCLGKMGDVAQSGRTVLFVSHNMTAIQSLCKQTIWIDQGALKLKGPAPEVVQSYFQSTLLATAERIWDGKDIAPGNEKVKIRKFSIHPENKFVDQPITTETPLVIEIEFWNQVKSGVIHSTLHVHDERGLIAFSTFPSAELMKHIGPLPKGVIHTECHIPGNLLNSGTYRVTVLFVENRSQGIFRYEDALIFEVEDSSSRSEGWMGKEPGSVHPILEWNMEYIGME